MSAIQDAPALIILRQGHGRLADRRYSFHSPGPRNLRHPFVS